MATEYVRGYQDSSGGSHMFAVWVGEAEPDESDDAGWAWVRADKVLWVKLNPGYYKGEKLTQLVFDGGNTLTTDAEAVDVRWAIDLALNGAEHRTKPKLNLASEATHEAYQDAQLAGFLAASAAFKRHRNGQN